MRYPLTLYWVGGCFVLVYSPVLHPVAAQTQRLQVKSICHLKKRKPLGNLKIVSSIVSILAGTLQIVKLIIEILKGF